VVAVAVNQVDAVAGAGAVVGAGYPLLADPEHQVAEAYGVYNLLGDGLAAPAVFVIASDGRILWSAVGQSSADRPPAALILQQLPQ